MRIIPIGYISFLVVALLVAGLVGCKRRPYIFNSRCFVIGEGAGKNITTAHHLIIIGDHVLAARI